MSGVTDTPTAAPRSSAFARSAQLNELAAALAKAQGEFAPVVKGHTALVKHDKGQYEYAYETLADVLNATRPSLSANGLTLLQAPEVDDSYVTVTSLLIHSSGQWLETAFSWPAPMDPKRPPSAQDAGKLITYLKRYAASALLAVAGEKDDAGGGAPEHRAPGRGQQPPSRPIAPEVGDQARAALRSLWHAKLRDFEDSDAIPPMVDHERHAVQAWIFRGAASLNDLTDHDTREALAWLRGVPAAELVDAINEGLQRQAGGGA